MNQAPTTNAGLMNQTPIKLFPEKKTFPTFGKVSGDIIQDHKDKQENEHNKSNLHHSLFDLSTEISSE